MTDKFISQFGQNNRKKCKVLHSGPKIVLGMMKITEINSEMTKKLRPNSDI